MNPRVIMVQPQKDYSLILEFENGEKKVFDVKPYLEIGIFNELKNINTFVSVKPVFGTIQWPNGQDFCPDTLYLESEPFKN